MLFRTTLAYNQIKRGGTVRKSIWHPISEAELRDRCTPAVSTIEKEARLILPMHWPSEIDQWADHPRHVYNYLDESSFNPSPCTSGSLRQRCHRLAQELTVVYEGPYKDTNTVSLCHRKRENSHCLACLCLPEKLKTNNAAVGTSRSIPTLHKNLIIVWGSRTYDKASIPINESGISGCDFHYRHRPSGERTELHVREALATIAATMVFQISI